MAHETSQTPYDLLRGKKLIIENKDSQTAIRTDYNLIVNNKIEFIQTELSVDKVTHTISADYGTEFANENVFNGVVAALDGYSYSYYKTHYSIPVEHKQLTAFENPGKLSTIRVNSVVNYYDPDIDDALRVTPENSMPDVYRFANPTRDKVTQEILFRETSATPNRSVFDNKLQPASFASNQGDFPCLVEVKITKDEIDGFRNVLRESDLYNSFMNDASLRVKDRISLVDTRTSTQSDYGYLLLNNLIANLTSVVEDDSFVTNQEDVNKDVSFLDKLKLIGDLQKKSLYHSNYKTIHEKDSVPNETLFYKIQKFAGTGTTTPIKTFLLPSSGDVTSLIDTQTSYNKSYTYKISAYVVVYAVKYSYTLVAADYDLGKAKYNVTSEPLPTVMEIDLFSTETVVAPNPPMPPSVNFINNSNSQNKIKIALELQKGEMEGDFIPLLSNDSSLRMKRNHLTNKVLFRFIEEPMQAQMFRMEERPESIQDFADHYVRNIFVNGTSRQFNYSNIIFDDNVFPNKKYYYMFRTFSHSNMVSNPSPVFEVELIKDSDDSHLLIEPVVFSSDMDTTFANFRKLMQIKPALRHTSLPVAAYDRDEFGNLVGLGTKAIPANSLLDGLTLGSTDDPIWGRKFKFRVRSNESGKLIDINIKFQLTKDKK